MHPSTAKYFGEQDERHGGRLHWPGVNGIPFRGPYVPNLKRNELEKLPPVACAFHHTFNLSDDKESAVYQWIRDRIRNGSFTLDWIERHWDAESKTMWVYVEWSQLYIELPHNNATGSNGDGHPNHFTLRSTG